MRPMCLPIRHYTKSTSTLNESENHSMLRPRVQNKIYIYIYKLVIDEELGQFIRASFFFSRVNGSYCTENFERKSLKRNLNT